MYELVQGSKSQIVFHCFLKPGRVVSPIPKHCVIRGTSLSASSFFLTGQIYAVKTSLYKDTCLTMLLFVALALFEPCHTFFPLCFMKRQVSSIDGSTAGLVITYSLNFTLAIVFTVRLHAQMEMSVNSIERLDEYCKVLCVCAYLGYVSLFNILIPMGTPCDLQYGEWGYAMYCGH